MLRLSSYACPRWVLPINLGFLERTGDDDAEIEFSPLFHSFYCRFLFCFLCNFSFHLCNLEEIRVSSENENEACAESDTGVSYSSFLLLL